MSNNEKQPLNLDDLEIDKEATGTPLNMKDLDNVSGGRIHKVDDSWYEIFDYIGGKLIGTFRTLEEARFVASGVCPRCGKVFSDTQAIEDHIKAWESGQM